jgi:exonuclease III
MRNNDVVEMRVVTQNVRGLYKTTQSLFSHLKGLRALSETNKTLTILTQLLKVEKYSIVVLTETKLSSKEESTIKKLADGYFVHFNNNTKKSKGLITFFSKQLFDEPTHEILVAGQLSLSKVNFKFGDISPFSVFSYYCSNRGTYAEILRNIVEKNFNGHDGFIVGDFNEVIDVSIDRVSIVNNNNKNNKNTVTMETQLKVFVRNLDLSFHRSNYTFKKANGCKSRIDWIFCRGKFKGYFSTGETRESSFENADHNLLINTFNIQKKKGRTFFSDLKINEETKKETALKMTKIINSEKPLNEKYSKLNKFSIELLKNFQGNIAKRLKSKLNKLTKAIHQENNLLEIEIKKKNLENWLMDIGRKHFWKRNIFFSSINGPNQIISRASKMYVNTISKVTGIQNENNVIVTGKEAANLVKQHFENLFKDVPVDKDLGNCFLNPFKSPIQFLNEPFTFYEMLDSIYETPNKTPGLSGIPISYLKDFASVYAEILCQVANELRINPNANFDDLLQGLIILIPKGTQDPNIINNLRGITLLEIARKIITRAFTKRLKKTMIEKNLISEAQSCFKGRDIRNNLAHLTFIAQAHKGIKQNMYAMFYDYSKAFDTVSWDFMKRFLLNYFGQKVVNFIMNCNKHKCTIFIDGSFSESFMKERGIPQGETYASDIFILLMQIFLLQFDSGLIISFADDQLTFSLSREDAEKMLEILKNAKEIMSLELNVNKSYYSIINNNIKEDDINGVTCSMETNKYLGVSFKCGVPINDIDKDIQLMPIKLKGIKARFPDFTTSINCLKAYIHGLLYHKAAFVVIKQEQIKQINNIQKWFLFSKENSFNPNKKYYSNISLKRLALPKKDGGCGLKTIEQLFSDCKTWIMLHLYKNKQNRPMWVEYLKDALDDVFIDNSKSFIHPMFIMYKETAYKNDYMNKWLAQVSMSFSQIPKHFNIKKIPKKYKINQHFKFQNKFMENCFKNPQDYHKVDDKNKFRFPNSIEYNIIQPNKSISSNYSPESLAPVAFQNSRRIPCKKIEIWDLVRYKIDFPLNSKISLKQIFLTRSQFSPIELTKTQLKWINIDKINLLKLFTTKLSATNSVKNFFNKLTKNYFKTKDSKCVLCDGKFCSIHIINDCPFIRKIEEETYSTFLINKRIKNSFITLNKEDFSYSWILNWCLWRVSNSIIHNPDVYPISEPQDKFLTILNAKIKLKSLIQLEEINHIHHILKVKQKHNVKPELFRNHKYFTINKNCELICIEK